MKFASKIFKTRETHLHLECNKIEECLALPLHVQRWSMNQAATILLGILSFLVLEALTWAFLALIFWNDLSINMDFL